MRTLFLSLFLSAVSLVPLGSSTRGSDPIPEARVLIEAKRFDDAALLLDGWLRANPGTPAVYDLYATVLMELQRPDEAAHHLALALDALSDSGRWNTKEYVALRRRLYRADPLGRKRDVLFEKIAGSLGDVAAKMLAEGHAERALDLLDRLHPIARGEVRVEIEVLRQRAQAAFTEVNLDEAGADAAPGERALIERESRFYLFEANLEAEVLDLVAATMDDIFLYYVEVYFGGDFDRASERKATIRIHPTHASMIADYGSPGASVGGWWSMSEWRVVCYDTRSTGATLDVMLETLFHEASHQFMSMLSARGGSSPAWLNEGTACFFEGATAMADRRVLWPDAAEGRLGNLASMLRTKAGPRVRDVVAYSQPGSYDAEYYPFGWGLVYYFQQYEDPASLEYVWRPYYARYLEQVTKRGDDPMALFAKVFLEDGNPGGFADFDAFAAHWQDWILSDVYPIHHGPDRRRLRLDRLRTYVAAADLAAGKRRAKVTEKELLLRALRQVEFIRTTIDEGQTPDGELLLTQADVLERLDRKGTAAALIEAALELAAAGSFPLEPDRQALLEERMGLLDRRNAPLRQLRLRSKSFLVRAHALLREYEKAEQPLLLRGLDLARTAATLFDEDEMLRERVAHLHQQTVAAGLIPSRIVRIAGKEWATIFTTEEETFTHAEGTVRLAMPARVAGRICLDVPIEGEYEVHATLRRRGEVFRSSFHGVVVTGTPSHDWYAVGIGNRDRLVLKRCDLDSTGAPTTKTVHTFDLAPPIAPDEVLELAVRVRPNGAITVTFPGAPARAPLEFTLPELPPPTSYVGIMVKDADLALEDLRVEILP